jgi:hypothetical protein
MKKTRYSKILLSVAFFMVVLLISGQAFAQVTGRDVVNEALKYEGNRVVMDSAEGVQYIYGKLGIQLPGTLDALSRQGTLVKKGADVTTRRHCIFWNKLQQLNRCRDLCGE